MLVHALDAPETAAGDHRGLDAIGGLNVGSGGRNDDGLLRGSRGGDGENGERQRADGGSAQRKAAEIGEGTWFPLGMVGGSLEPERCFAIGSFLSDVPKIRPWPQIVTGRHTSS